MTEDLEKALYAMRAEFERQAATGDADYHGVATDGLDGLDGYFDLRKVAEAVLNAVERAP
jgi:hypothetical protein